jgi:hypothetical protein
MNMPTLTVKEKEFWRNRLAKKIEKKIEAVCTRAPHLLERIASQAQQRALDSLSLAALQAELDSFQRQEMALEESRKRVHQEMLAAIRHVPVEEVHEEWFGQPNLEIGQAINKRRAIHELELMAHDDVGREILNLRREKEDLLDTIWLATSPAEVKGLWAKAMELLGDEQTPLQREALAIESKNDAGT